MPFETALTKALDLRVPVVAAPLGRGTSAEFLGAMANSGSFGFAALMHLPEDAVSDELANISRATNGRFGANLTLVVDQRKRLAAARGSTSLAPGIEKGVCSKNDMEMNLADLSPLLSRSYPLKYLNNRQFRGFHRGAFALRG